MLTNENTIGYEQFELNELNERAAQLTESGMDLRDAEEAILREYDSEMVAVFGN